MLTPPTLSSRRGPNAATREHDVTALTPNTTPASVMVVFSGTITISGDGSGYAVSAARIKRLTPRLLGRIATDWVLELLPATRSGHLADELLRGRGRCKSTSIVLRSKLYTSSGTRGEGKVNGMSQLLISPLSMIRDSPHLFLPVDRVVVLREVGLGCIIVVAVLDTYSIEIVVH